MGYNLAAAQSLGAVTLARWSVVWLMLDGFWRLKQR
jgi:hypothetical protein